MPGSGRTGDLFELRHQRGKPIMQLVPVHRCAVAGPGNFRPWIRKRFDGRSSRASVRREVGWWTVDLLFLGHHGVERFLLGRHERIARNQHPALLSEERDVAIGVTAREDSAPARYFAEHRASRTT